MINEQPLTQLQPHHNGPESCEERYFFYTGNTSWGIQNLEYDPHTRYWFTAVYPGAKPAFENFRMVLLKTGTLVITKIRAQAVCLSPVFSVLRIAFAYSALMSGIFP